MCVRVFCFRFIANYMARAVADDCIPPKYITKPVDIDSMNEHAMAAVKQADTLLNMKQGLAHLDNVWGMGGPLRPVKLITREMTLLLKEYLSSRDIQEAHRCLRALEVPHFHHELVYEVSVRCRGVIEMGFLLLQILVFLFLGHCHGIGVVEYKY